MRPKNRNRRAGLTLLELLLASAGTALVGVAIMMMLTAVTWGTRSNSDLRQAVIKQRAIAGRITAAVRSSCMVLAAEDDLLVLWVADLDLSGTPNLAEIRRIERDDASGELRHYMAPGDLSPAANTEYLLDADFATVTAALRNSAAFPREVWATGTTSWSIATDMENVQDTTLVSTRLTLDLGEHEEPMLAVAALRSTGTTSFIHADDIWDMTDDVDFDGDEDGDESNGKGKKKSKHKGKGKGKAKGDKKGKGHHHDHHDHHDKHHHKHG